MQALLQIVGITYADEAELDGKVIHRSSLVEPQAVEQLQKQLQLQLPTLRSMYSTHNMPALHRNAEAKQRHPVVCLLRQLLKKHGYRMVPGVQSAGYDSAKRKRVKRIYTIVRV